MKKIAPLLLILLACGFAFLSCSDTKTYAELLDDEKKAIKKFIKSNGIKVISNAEFEAKGNVTDLTANEFVQLSGGVYMQIVDKGTGDSIRNRDVVTVRLIEYDIFAADTTGASNYKEAQYLDSFDYTVSENALNGRFKTGVGEVGVFSLYYNTAAVPAGWLSCLPYIKDDAHVKLIVPSKAGHENAARYIYPYYYDLIRIRVY